MTRMIHDPLVSPYQEADLHFDPLLLDCQGTWAELLEHLKANYTRKIAQVPAGSEEVGPSEWKAAIKHEDKNEQIKKC